MTQQSHYWVYTQRNINHSFTKVHARFIFVALFTIAKTWYQPKCPSVIDWVRKMWYIYNMEYYAAIQRNEVEARTWTKPEAIIISKLMQEQKTKHHMFSLISES